MPTVTGRSRRERAERMERSRLRGEGTSFGTYPEDNVRELPVAPTLSSNKPIYTGEWREEETTTAPVGVAPGGVVTLVSLRRPWPSVGIALDPGNLIAPNTLTALVIAKTRGMNAVVASFVVGPKSTLPGNLPFAASLLLAPARFELAVVLSGGASIIGVRGSIWAGNLPGGGPGDPAMRGST